MAKFKAGTSGNPKGRPRADVSAAKLRLAIAGRADEVLQVVVNSALEGDMMACKLLMDRVCPPLKPSAAAITVTVGESLSDTGRNILSATASGRIPPDVASQLISALAAQCKIIEIDELTKRVAALEGKP